MLRLPLSIVDLLPQIQQKYPQAPSSPQALAKMPGFNWPLSALQDPTFNTALSNCDLRDHRWGWCPPYSPPLLLTISRKFLLWFLGLIAITTLLLPHCYYLLHSWLCPLIIYRLWHLTQPPFSIPSPTVNLGTSSSPWISCPTSYYSSPWPSSSRDLHYYSIFCAHSLV